MQTVSAKPSSDIQASQPLNEPKTHPVVPDGISHICVPEYAPSRKTFFERWIWDSDENDTSPPDPPATRPQHEEATKVQPTTGMDYLDMASNFVRDLGVFGNIPVNDKLIKEIEGILILTLTVQGCQDYVSICSAILLYARTFFSTSITNQVRLYLYDMFKITPQDGVETTKTPPSWLKMMRDARTNWTLCKDNLLFENFSKVLGLLVALGMCNVADCTFSIKEYKLFEPDLKVVHGTAFEIIDAMFASVTFFVESMYASFQARSLKPFLMSDTEAMAVDEEFSLLQSWWVLVKNGNLYKVAGKEDQEYDDRLEGLTSKIKIIAKAAKGLEKKLLNDKLSKLVGMKNDYITFKIANGVRRAPFALQFFGESSQGKTTCSDQMIDAMLASAGLQTGKEYRAAVNPGDKYQSNWTTKKTVMIIDDLGNSKADFVTAPPTQAIIDVCNNQMYYANMADLESKGKVFIEPTIVSVTTNIKHLDAGTYSNCPYSVQRRMHVVITVLAKREFQRIVNGKPQGLDTPKIVAFNKKLKRKPLFDDIWELTLERAVCPEKLRWVADYAPIEWRGRKMVRVPFRDAVQYVIEQFHIHRDGQQSIMDDIQSRMNIHLCPHEGCRNIREYCSDHDHLYEFTEEGEYQLKGVTLTGDDQNHVSQEERKCTGKCMEPHFGDEIIASATRATDIVLGRIRKDLFGMDRLVEGATSLALLTSARLFAKHWDWITVLPTPWVENDTVQKMLMLVNRDKLRRHYIVETCLQWGAAGLFVGSMWHQTRDKSRTGWLALGMSGICISRQKYMVKLVMKNYRKELLNRNVCHPAIKSWRDEHAGTVIKAAGVVGAIYALSKLYRRWRSLNPQGSLEPTTQEEIDKRDSEVNPWIGVSKAPLPISKVSYCTPNEHLNARIEKNLRYGTVMVGNRKLMVNGLFLRTQLVVIPHHYFEMDTLDVTFYGDKPDTSGGHFATKLCKAASYHIPNTDLCICYSSTGGSFKNLSEWLPTDNMPYHEFQMLWRAKDGSVTRAKGLARPGITSNGICDFVGGTYETLSMDTFKGLCGAPIVSQGKASCLSGIHLGGRSGTPQGCYGVVTLSNMVDAMTYLRTVEGVIFSGDADDFEKQNLGVTVVTDEPMNPKSPLNYLPEHSQIAYYGSCPGATTNRSDVKVTPISASVLDVTGYPNIYCGPKFSPPYFGWQSNLANLSVPAHPFPHSILARSITDYKSALLPIFRSDLWKDARPLTEQENMVGIPGKKFMDGIKLNTAIGFPLVGAKRKYVTEIEIESDMEGRRRKLVFDDAIRSEIERCEQLYRKGLRANTIAKACKKDEILAKPKCRIFYSNPIALTFLLRKYFLPVMRVMQMNPLASECAVGINSHGPEWQDLHDHVFMFGRDRLIGGDYGKYDQKLPSQLIFAAFRMLIDFARECNYTEEDLAIMEAMTGDVVYAYIAFNGDLIGLSEGGHIAGNSITVIVNGLCGSLNLRVYFYSDPQHWDLNFRENVALITYGDDNIGSVKDTVSNFTIKGASLFLEKYGQTYTMPDKESELVDFLPPEDFEFLKRKSVYCPKKGMHVGALLDKSIFKMLHMYMRPKGTVNTPEFACALNIDTALREWANHGEEAYEMRRLQMQQVARLNDITHLCTQLNVTYRQSVEEWYWKYFGGAEDDSQLCIGEETEPMSFECQ
jgi:hypothetical protein